MSRSGRFSITMPNPQSVAHVAIAAAAVVLVWRVGTRLRRAIGRQEFHLRRARFSAYVLPVALLMLLAVAFAQPWHALAQAGGVGLGIAAARYSLRTTTFEVTPAGHFYTPNPYVGSAIVALFLARVVYRLTLGYLGTDGFTAPPSEALRNPFTIFVAGLVLGYYSWHAWGLLRWYKQTPRGSNRTGTSAASGSQGGSGG
jgi:hypothetical protein